MESKYRSPLARLGMNLWQVNLEGLSKSLMHINPDRKRYSKPKEPEYMRYDLICYKEKMRLPLFIYLGMHEVFLRIYKKPQTLVSNYCQH